MRVPLFSCLLGAALCFAAPVAAQEETPVEAAPTLLVYSATAGWRHDSIDEAWAALAAIAQERGWSVVFTEDPAWFDPERIAQFDSVVWALATGDTLSATQKAAFRSFVEDGGGFVGLHSAGDASHTWDWYAGELIGATFIGHPLDPGVRSGSVDVEVNGHPATAHLPRRWHLVDEWYSFDRSVRGEFRVLATLDEETYVPGRWNDGVALDMGDDHPIVWDRCVGEGRAFYSALGHTAESYADPQMRALIAGGIGWSLGEGDCPQKR